MCLPLGLKPGEGLYECFDIGLRRVLGTLVGLRRPGITHIYLHMALTDLSCGVAPIIGVYSWRSGYIVTRTRYSHVTWMHLDIRTTAADRCIHANHMPLPGPLIHAESGNSNQGHWIMPTVIRRIIKRASSATGVKQTERTHLYSSYAITSYHRATVSCRLRAFDSIVRSRTTESKPIEHYVVFLLMILLWKLYRATPQSLPQHVHYIVH